jgi:hypothetical protein
MAYKAYRREIEYNRQISSPRRARPHLGDLRRMSHLEWPPRSPDG